MSAISKVRRKLFGAPIASKHAHHERLKKRYGLPVFASDALSSVAYATEEVMLTLITAVTLVAYYDLFPISIALACLLAIVAFSYYQTIHAYPKGGGSYMVSKTNLGPAAGMVAGAALMMDYVLTVSVSVSSGVAALVSAVPDLHDYMLPIAVGAILLIGYINLRGARESGVIFAIPTYSFVVLILFLVVWGVFGPGGFTQPNITPNVPPEGMTHAITYFFVLRAFSAACTALTGIEAISDGVQAFRPPEARNASITLGIMASLLVTMFVGVSWCAQHYGIVPMKSGEGYQTVLAQLASTLFGSGTVLFWGITISTTLILFLAANTAFADFPRLCSFIARDGYLPRQLTTIGDRLVFQNGIIVLTLVAIGLVWMFNADTHMLVPLYAVGVFTAFTMSQSGMIARWLKMKKYGFGLVVNVIGALATGIVTIILAVTKFEEGAWIIIIAVPAVMLVFWLIRRHYDNLAKALSVSPGDRVGHTKATAFLLVPRLHKGILQAISYARTLSTDIRALHVTINSQSAAEIKQQWREFGEDMPLVILESPYRSLTEPILEYIDQALEEDPDCFITVIVPQAVPKYWWQSALHGNVAVRLKIALGARKNVVISNVRYFLQ